MADTAEHPAVSNFRTYLQINTAQPCPDYGEALMFFEAMAAEIGLEYRVADLVAGKSVAILSLPGQQPDLPSIMLYSHIDVVPVYPEHWKYPPFSAYKDENGDIYARGSQDMKCVGIQYLEAVRSLMQQGIQLQRTVHIVFGPDEEIGAKEGMELFVKHEEFKKLNTGFALDEGLASPTDVFRVFYSQRCVWWFSVTFTGQPGHGSAFIEDTAMSKLNKLMNRTLKFRAEQEAKLKADPSLTLGDVTTLNINILKGGVQYNVVPAEMTAGFDMRVPPTANLKQLEAEIKGWCQEAGAEYTLEWLQKGQDQDITSTEDSDVWWSAFSKACQAMNLKVKKEIFPAGSDGRLLRKLGIPVLGFSPMINTPVLLHDHNEYLNEQVFLNGIKVYEKVISSLANVLEVEN